MIKINLHKNLSDFSPLRRYPRKIAFFTNKLYISDVYHIFLNRRDVKAYENQCFVWSLFWYRYVKFQALAHGLYGYFGIQAVFITPRPSLFRLWK